MEAPPISMTPPKRGRDPDRIAAMNQRSREKTERAKLAAEVKREELKLKREAREAAMKPPPAPVAGLPELVALWSGFILDPAAKGSDALEASRLLADALGLTKGGTVGSYERGVLGLSPAAQSRYLRAIRARKITH